MIGKMTDIGKQKLCKAHAGDTPLPKIEKMVFGSGGTAEDGTPLAVSGMETALKTQMLEKNIASRSFPSLVSCEYICRLTKAELAGQYVSEVGLVDADGDLVAYRTMRSIGKDDDMEIEFSITETFAEVEGKEPVLESEQQKEA